MEPSTTPDSFAFQGNSLEFSHTQLVEKSQLQTVMPSSPTPESEDVTNPPPMSTARLITLMAGLCLSLFLVTLDFVCPIAGSADWTRIY